MSKHVAYKSLDVWTVLETEEFNKAIESGEWFALPPEWMQTKKEVEAVIEKALEAAEEVKAPKAKKEKAK